MMFKSIKEFVNTIAYIVDEEMNGEKVQIYRSRQDDSYVGMVGQEMDGLLEFQMDHGITRVFKLDGEVACIGLSTREQKWYGWSHRAIYGFGVGSEVKKGDCAYAPKDKYDFLENMISFWENEHHAYTEGEHVVLSDNLVPIHGVEVSWMYNEDVPNKKLIGTMSSTFMEYPEKFGKGEWQAETMEDAKQMACDFAKGVS